MSEKKKIYEAKSELSELLSKLETFCDSRDDCKCCPLLGYADCDFHELDSKNYRDYQRLAEKLPSSNSANDEEKKTTLKLKSINGALVLELNKFCDDHSHCYLCPLRECDCCFEELDILTLKSYMDFISKIGEGEKEEMKMKVKKSEAGMKNSLIFDLDSFCKDRSDCCLCPLFTYNCHFEDLDISTLKSYMALIAKIRELETLGRDRDTPKAPSGTDNNISHPSHYVDGRKFEPKDVIRDWDLNFNLGSAVKYISRAGRKDGNDILTDLKKARVFLGFEIEAIENERKAKGETK